MLRIYFFQHWLNLSDPAIEEALYDAAVCWHRPWRRAGAG
jgi:IS5 family transposase